MTAHEIVAKARNLPRIPTVALKLVELLDEFKDNHHEAVGLIKSDGLLTAKLLRVCNSSALGLEERVASVDHAVLLLGYNQVLSFVMSLSFGGAMTGALPCYAIEVYGLWRHAFMTATAAETAVTRGLSDDKDASVAFTAGLLHDFGKLVMTEALTDEARSAIRHHMSGEGLGSIEAEREVLGTDHAEVGSCLLLTWRLPDWIVEAVANHHRPIFEPTPQLSAIVHVANRIAHLADERPGSETYAFRGDERVVQIFELDAKEQSELVGAARKSADRAMELLAIV